MRLLAVVSHGWMRMGKNVAYTTAMPQGLFAKHKTQSQPTDFDDVAIV
jgi:hypothetical protein